MVARVFSPTLELPPDVVRCCCCSLALELRALLWAGIVGDGDDDEGERGEREDRAAGYSDRLPLVGHRLLSHAQSGSVNFTLALYHIHGNSCRVADEIWREYNFSRSR